MHHGSDSPVNFHRCFGNQNASDITENKSIKDQVLLQHEENLSENEVHVKASQPARRWEEEQKKVSIDFQKPAVPEPRFTVARLPSRVDSQSTVPSAYVIVILAWVSKDPCILFRKVNSVVWGLIAFSWSQNSLGNPVFLPHLFPAVKFSLV